MHVNISTVFLFHSFSVILSPAYNEMRTLQRLVINLYRAYVGMSTRKNKGGSHMIPYTHFIKHCFVAYFVIFVVEKEYILSRHYQAVIK